MVNEPSVFELLRFDCRTVSHTVRKHTFLHVRLTKTKISMCFRAVWSESSLSARRNLAYLAIQKCFQLIFLLDSVNAQPDRNLRWAHMSEGMFSDVADQKDKCRFFLSVSRGREMTGFDTEMLFTTDCFWKTKVISRCFVMLTYLTKSALVQEIKMHNLHNVTVWQKYSKNHVLYLEISELQKCGKQPHLTNEYVIWLLKLETYWKYCGKEEKLLPLFHNILLPVLRC